MITQTAANITATEITPIFTNLTLFNLGHELLAIGAALIISLMLSQLKTDMTVSFSLSYLSLFWVGYATNLPILIIISLLTFVYIKNQ